MHERRFGHLCLAAAAAMVLFAPPAPAATVDDVIAALGIRDYFRASEEQCRVGAVDYARRLAADHVTRQLGGTPPSGETRERLDRLYKTYAEEACRLGIDDGLIQRYRAAYAAALSEQDLQAALRFLTSAQGKSFVRAGLIADREVLPLIMRRQQSQASRASALFQTRLASLLAELSGGGGAKAQ